MSSMMEASSGMGRESKDLKDFGCCFFNLKKHTIYSLTYFVLGVPLLLRQLINLSALFFLLLPCSGQILGLT